MLKDNSKRAYHLIIIFSIIIVVLIIAIISETLELSLLEKILNGKNLTQNEINTSDLRSGIIAVIQAVTYLISIFLFLNWFRRAYGNLLRAGIKTKYSEKWAIWSFLVPIISLFRPYLIMEEIWTETQKAIKLRDHKFYANYNTTPIFFWWILFISSHLVGNYILKKVLKEETIEEMIIITKAYLISDVIHIIEASIVMLIIYRISIMENMLFSLNKR